MLSLREAYASTEEYGRRRRRRKRRYPKVRPTHINENDLRQCYTLRKGCEKLVLNCHPDRKSGSKQKFLELRQQCEEFKKNEVAWTKARLQCKSDVATNHLHALIQSIRSEFLQQGG